MAFKARWGNLGFFALIFAGLILVEPSSSIRSARAQESGSGESHEPTDGGEGEGQGRRGRRSVRNRMPVGTATARFDGKEVRITFGKAVTTHNDFKQIAEAKDGAVIRFVAQAATKLRTAANLKFGDTIIKTENIAPKYPGIYTLWLKKAGEGWKLVFNKDGDIWGTMHDPANDVAEVPLEHAKLEKEVTNFTVELKSEADGKSGAIRLAWGTDEWTTKFEVVE